MISGSLPIMPAVKPSAWPARAEALCRPLAALPGVRHVPWVGFGYQHDNTFEFLTRYSFPGANLSDSLRIIEQAALRSLRQRKPAWKVEKVRLGLLRSMALLIISDDPLAAEQILDPQAMQRAAQMLKARRMAVAIPRRGVLVATSARLPRPLMSRFFEMVNGQYASAQSAGISPAVFLIEDGEITGGLNLPALETPRAPSGGEPYVEVLITADRLSGRETLHIIAGFARFERLFSELRPVFLRAAAHMAQRAEFSGRVIVTIIPELTPAPPDLPGALAEVENTLRAAAADAGVTAAAEGGMQVTVRYGSPADASGSSPSLSMRGASI